MKFTIELRPFIKMIETVGKLMPGQKRSDPNLRLYACAARVFVEANSSVAGSEALVLEDGGCTLPRTKFLVVLKTYLGRKNLTISVDHGGLRIGNFTLLVTDYSAHVKPPGDFQVFPVTDFPALFPDKPPPMPEPAPRPTLAPETKPKPSSVRFPISEADLALVEQVVGLTRRLCALPSIKPAQLVGLARALYALERLPLISKGVSVEFNVGVPLGTDKSYYTFTISDLAFSVGTLFMTPDDHRSTTLFEVEATGFRSLRSNDEEGGVDVWLAMEQAKAMMAENDRSELLLSVYDQSTPDCLAEDAASR
jgi:hypothetical protein